MFFGLDVECGIVCVVGVVVEFCEVEIVDIFVVVVFCGIEIDGVLVIFCGFEIVGVFFLWFDIILLLNIMFM